ncbi:Toll-Interleukin receptor [Candidatus Koribacter versatilis Ellin345]|uniref:Toll-Interleukin receptor n=1 Tax=Koribacter versatilis (strain Ellin345) TaxID=204669 RepID=Q1IKX5_KORVE|nr:toll/interleukin-1 receptor domain-containing protein [Candidatus Koribacter versatilis]ABF42475.1 Toll-Interleukin receptor [Candidatus Koribacter versatilis Ellin345]
MPPKVFVSYASEDKQRFVLQFATELRANGVEAWLDRWEILPGDSLVEKLFNEGLKNADAVIVVVSSTSVVKPWVKAELDTATVNRITKQVKIIPVVIDSCEIPESLKSLLWVRIHNLQSYVDELHQILSAIFEVRTKPPIGDPPSYVKERQISGLQQSDCALFRALYDHWINAGREVLSVNEASELVPSLGKDQFLDSSEILEEKGYVRITHLSGSGSRGIGILRPSLNGFMVYMRAYNPGFEDEARRVAMMILNHGLMNARTIAEETGLNLFVVGKILEWFASSRWLKLSATIGSVHIVSISPSLKRQYQ